LRRERRGFWIAFCAVFFYPTGWLVGRSRFEGLQHIPAEGGVLLVANHVSHLDPIFSGLVVDRAGRVPRFMAKHSLWRVPLLRNALRGSQQIPVYRNTSDAQRSLRDGVAALDGGKAVIIYPEGTITRDPEGWPMQARTGAARLALSARVPVVPVVHWGTREVLDGYRHRFRPR
jgi:1-acyl-sn-glycerol-3-phosphate acyltransferase